MLPDLGVLGRLAELLVVPALRIGRLAVRDHFHKRTVRRNVDESKNCAIPVARIPSFRYSFDSRRSVRCASR